MVFESCDIPNNQAQSALDDLSVSAGETSSMGKKTQTRLDNHETFLMIMSIVDDLRWHRSSLGLHLLVSRTGGKVLRTGVPLSCRGR